MSYVILELAMFHQYTTLPDSPLFHLDHLTLAYLPFFHP